MRVAVALARLFVLLVAPSFILSLAQAVADYLHSDGVGIALFLVLAISSVEMLRRWSPV